MDNSQKTSSSGSAVKLREQTDAFSGAHARLALQQYRQSLRESKRIGDQSKSGWALVQMAMVLRGQRQYPMSLQLLEEAHAIFGQTRNTAGLAVTFYEMSYCNRELDRNALALEYGQTAIKLFQELGHLNDLAWAYDNLAIVFFNTFKRHESLTFAKKARTIHLENHSDVGLAWNSCHLGVLYLELGFPAKAEKLFQESREKFKILNHQQGLAWAILGLATVYRGQCKFVQAQDLIKNAKSIYKSLDLKDRVGWCILHEAAIKRFQGNDEDALLMNKRAVQLFSPLRNHDGVGWSLFQIGQILRDRGQFLKSWQTLREALNLHTDIANRKGVAWVENEWGKTYLELNDIAHSKESFIKAKVIAEQLGDGPLKIDVEKNLASLHLDEGNLQKAATLLDHVGTQVAEIESRDVEAENYLEKARYYLIMGEAKKARRWVDIADTLVERSGLHRLRPRLDVFKGEVLVSEGRFEDAEDVLKDAVQLAKKFSQRHIKARALLGLAQELIRQNSTKNLSGILSQIEKDVRVISTRKLKAKFLMVKGLAVFRTTGRFDNKTFGLALEAMKSSGLVVLRKQSLSVLIEIAEGAGLEREILSLKNDMKELLDQGPVDLHLVRPAKDLFVLPVSMVS